MRIRFYIIIMILAISLTFITSCNSKDTHKEVPTDTSQPTENEPSEDTLPPSTESKIVTDRFVFVSGEYNLNAVYTYINDGEKHPAVLLIAGSGPSDCDSTLGSLKPF